MPELAQLRPPDSHAIVTTEIIEMGGAERSTLALAQWLYHRGIPVHLVCYLDHVGIHRFANHPLTVVQLRPKMDPMYKIGSLRRYLRAYGRASVPLLSGYQTALHAAAGGIRGFHTLMHDTPSLFSAAKAPSFSTRITRKLSDLITAHGLRSGGTTLVASEYLRGETRRVFGVDAVIARMGGLASPESFRPRAMMANRLRMLSVSRIEPNKRIDWILRALADIEKSAAPLSALVDWALDITGKGSYLETARKLTRSLGLDRRVRFHGFVSDEELQLLYDSADLFLMPAVQGYGIPAIESLQRGIPVLLHRDSGVSDILLDTPWATVFEGGEETMRSALAFAIQSVRQGRQLGVPLPPIPTEEEWAEQVARACEWV